MTEPEKKNIAQQILEDCHSENYSEAVAATADMCCDLMVSPIEVHGEDDEHCTYTFEDGSTILITHDDDGYGMQASN